MALTADRIEEDLKKILNISSAAKVDLGVPNETERPPNGFHPIGAISTKSDATLDRCHDHGSHRDDQSYAKGTKHKKRNKKDYNKLVNFVVSGYSNKSGGSGPDVIHGSAKDNVLNGFYKGDNPQNISATEELESDCILKKDLLVTKNKRGSEVLKKKRSKKEVNHLDKTDIGSGSPDKKAGDAIDKTPEISKCPSISKRASKEKAWSSKSENKVENVDHNDLRSNEPSMQVATQLSGVPVRVLSIEDDLETWITSVLTSVYLEYKVSEEEVGRRRRAFDRLKDIVTEILPESNIRIYGSTGTGTSAKWSDVNVDVTTRQTKDDFKLLKAALETNHRDLIKNIELLYLNNALVLSMVWYEEGQNDFIFTIKANVEYSTHTSRLLRIYTLMDPRVAVLATCLRVWARRFHLDRQDEGTLPPHSFHIMVIFFLQRIQLLPVLHEMLIKEVVIDDEDDEEEGRKGQFIDPSHFEGLAEDWKTGDSQSVGCLWIKMLKFYDIFSFERQAINIRRSECTLRNTLGWGSKNIAIEDPYCTRRNLARSLCHGSIYNFFKRQLGSMRQAFYFKNVDLLVEKMENYRKTFFSSEFSSVLPPKMCTSCQNIGHTKKTCPEETVESVTPPPVPKEWVFQFLNKVLEDVLATNEQGPEEYRIKEMVKNDIEHMVKSIFPNKDPILTLFGSSCNGFGFRKSDLDLSLSFKGQETLEMPLCVQIINELADGLLRDNRLREVVAITTAKVPIVKFCLGDFECDICLYNTLAQHNTKLLARYAELDRRVRLLGYGIKHLAKVCHICDASKGSLSSYAYTLMAIYFLQRTSPPVLPVLQEVTNGKKQGGPRPIVVVEGWDVWFDDTVGRWRSENIQSAGQLWLEMIEFYSCYFDYENDVVSIRQRERLTKEDKNWGGQGIAIEDPFNLDHNLGARLTNRMCIYIRKAFQKAMMMFATEASVKEASMNRSAKYFLFNKMKLTDGPPPNDRGCRKCFKVGHFIADCPKLQKRKQKPSVAELENQNPMPSNDPQNAEKKNWASESISQPETENENRSVSHPRMQNSHPHIRSIMDKHQQIQQQQHMQLRMRPPPGMAMLQSPQKQPLLHMPPNMVPILPEGRMPFYPVGGVSFIMPQFQQFTHPQQTPMTMPGLQLRLPQTIPSLNTVFKRSDFPQLPQDPQHHPQPTPHHNHLPQPHHHQQQHPQQQHINHHPQQQQQQQQQSHPSGSSSPKVQFPLQ